jgi:hypothetical protein
MEEVAETVPLIACSGAVIVPTLNEPVLRLDVEALVAAKFVDVALVEVLFEVVKLEETIAPVVFIVATLSVSVLVVDAFVVDAKNVCVYVVARLVVPVAVRFDVFTPPYKLDVDVAVSVPTVAL